MAGMKAAAATAEIVVGDVPGSVGVPQEAPLRASALLIAGEAPICIVSCDMIALMKDSAEEIAKTIEATCGVPFDNTLVTATHTHHAPRPMPVYLTPRNEEVCRRTVAAAIAAGQRAKANLDAAGESGEAELIYALGQEGTVGENSRWVMKDGQVSWWKHDEADMVRPTGPHDPDLPVVALRRASGKLAGAVFCHGTHNIGTLSPEPRVISPGFFGLAAQELEREHGAPFLFVPGAFGSSHRRESYVKAPEAMTRVVNAVNETLGRARPMPQSPMVCVKRPFTCQYRHFDEAQADSAVSRWARRWFDAKGAEGLERTYRDVRKVMAKLSGQTFETTLHVIRIGEIAVAGVPGEMFARLGLEIRRRSPFRHTIVVGLSNDEVGYIPDRKGYEDGGYQTWVCGHSQLEPGTGETMVETMLSMLEEIHAAPASGTRRERKK